MSFERKPFRSMADRNQNQRVNSWSHQEEVFLVGAVMGRWFTSGSLAPARRVKVDADPYKAGKGELVDSWEEIKLNYDKAWNNYCRLHGVPPPTDRSSSALSRHFKIMKGKLEKGTSFKEYYLEWEIKFNYQGLSKLLEKHKDPASDTSSQPAKSPRASVASPCMERVNSHDWHDYDNALDLDLDNLLPPDSDLNNRNLYPIFSSKRKSPWLGNNYNTVSGDAGRALCNRLRPDFGTTDTDLRKSAKTERGNIFDLFEIGPEVETCNELAQELPEARHVSQRHNHYHTVQGSSGQALSAELKIELDRLK